MSRKLDCPTCGADMELDVDERISKLEKEKANLDERVNWLECEVATLKEMVKILEKAIKEHLAEQEETRHD